jgi:hypothetical protein
MRAIDRWVVRSSRASQAARSFRPRPGSIMCLDRRSNKVCKTTQYCSVFSDTLGCLSTGMMPPT